MSQAWPTADRPTSAEVAARTAVLTAALAGDLGPARTALDHPADRVRVTAVKCLAEAGELTDRAVAHATADDAPRVRRAIAMIGATDGRVDLAQLLVDADPEVVEPACWAAGERADVAALLPTLMSIATDHDDALCREAAVAALGAIGDPVALPAILSATGDRATVRRRAVLALAPFEGDEVDAALQRALADRDWQVRQAAEDLLPPG